MKKFKLEYWVPSGALLMALGIGLGAFGAHGLKDLLNEYALGVYDKAVFYHLLHSIGILAVATLGLIEVIPRSSANRVNCMLALGIFIFSGSLYTLAISGQRWLGAVTPLGGILFIAAWLLLAWESWPNAVRAKKA